MLVRRFPIGARGILGPLRHVLRCPVGEFVILALILSFSLDVIGLGAGRLSAQARSRFNRQVKDRHFRIRVARTFLAKRETSKCALSFIRVSPLHKFAAVNAHHDTLYP